MMKITSNYKNHLVRTKLLS